MERNGSDRKEMEQRERGGVMGVRDRKCCKRFEEKIVM